LLDIVDEEIQAIVTTSYFNYYAHFQRLEYHDDDLEAYVQSVIGEDIDFTLNESEFIGHDEAAKRFVEKLNITLHDEDVSDQIYLSPLLFSKETDNPFKLKKRLYPVDLAYPVSRSDVVKMNIPEGYSVVELPESVRMKIPDGTASFDFFVEQKDNAVSILSKIKFSKTMYSPEEYHTLKQLYDKIIEKHAEQLVLKKN